jgi:anti-sigma regulatory factor (Ser/Thr protein kinase)
VRLGRLIDNVLDFAKIERGMGVYEFAEADVGEVVDRAIELSARRVAAADMTLEADIAHDMPAIQLDANAFTLAVLNLIDNAIKYAADGKRIALAASCDDDRIELTVRDWGPGSIRGARADMTAYRAGDPAARSAARHRPGAGQHIARTRRRAAVTSVPGWRDVPSGFRFLVLVSGVRIGRHPEKAHPGDRGRVRHRARLARRARVRGFEVQARGTRRGSSPRWTGRPTRCCST